MEKFHAAYAVLVGGSILMVINFLFGFYLRRCLKKNKQRPQILLANFYGAELIKLLLLASSLAVAFSFFAITSVPLVLGFIVVQGAILLLPLFLHRVKQR